jgi:cellobiose dehydrogenase (acceptor)
MRGPALNSGRFHCCTTQHIVLFLSDHVRRQTISEDQTRGGLEWGYVLPGEPTGNNDEYIGYLVSSETAASCMYMCVHCIDMIQKGSLDSGRQGWSGISHNGGMPNSLLLVAWPETDAVKTKFVWAG